MTGLSEDNEELEDALDSFCAGIAEGEDVPIWICTLAQYQPKKGPWVHDVGPTVAQQLELDPFGCVLRSGSLAQGHGLVAIHTTTADLYCRLWCPYEMSQASRARIRVLAAASTKFLKQMRETYEYFYDVVTKDEEEAYNVVIKLMKPNTENAKCSSKQDEHRIREAILSQGGFGVLDEIVFHLRKKLVIDEFLHHAAPLATSSQSGVRSDSTRSWPGQMPVEQQAGLLPKSRPRTSSCQVEISNPSRQLALTQEGSPPQVVFSFQSRNLDLLIRIRTSLNDNGVATIDGTQTPAGQDWRRWFFPKLRAAKVVVALISKGFLFSRACEDELTFSYDQGIKIIPLLVDEEALDVLHNPEHYTLEYQNIEIVAPKISSMLQGMQFLPVPSGAPFNKSPEAFADNTSRLLGMIQEQLTR